MGNGSRLLNPVNAQTNNINDSAALATALHSISDQLAQHNVMYKEILDSIYKTRQKPLIVDVDRSTTSNTTLALPPFAGNLYIVEAVIFSVPSAATLNVGKRAIPIPAAGVQALPFSPAGMVLYPSDVVSLTIGAPGAMFLEVIAEQMTPDDPRRIVRQ